MSASAATVRVYVLEAAVSSIVSAQSLAAAVKTVILYAETTGVIAVLTMDTTMVATRTATTTLAVTRRVTGRL